VKTEEFDYVIVGAGSAGCTLAYRLGENPALRILVLEAGGEDRSSVIKTPLLWGLILKNRLFDWGYFSEPEAAMDNRRVECARGKVVGGSSSINGMAYGRGARQDYDFWADGLGLPGWSYDDVLPYFKRSESWEGGESELRGGKGPLTVMNLNFEDPLVGGFLRATERCGYHSNPDYNGSSVEGFGPMQATIRNGKRCSAAVAYLRPALARQNVILITEALVSRVVLDQSPSPKATGVEYTCNGERFLANVRHEVILAGRVINSPQLLMLSGIGDPVALAEHGIKARVSLPGVGQNLHDHVVFDLRFNRLKTGTLHRMMRYDRIALDVAKNFLFGNGFSGKIPAAAVGLIRTQSQLDLPDAQLILAAGPMTAAPYFHPFVKPYRDGFGIKGVFLTPESRGRVRLASADPAAPMLIEQNFLATENDRRSVREMFKRMREIAAQPYLQAFVEQEVWPGANCNSDDEIDAFIRRTAITLHHPVGTCKMGSDDDPMAVLDEQMRVRGVQGLRVVDGSSIPRVMRAATNAPIIMMAEKVSDLIVGKELPAVAGKAKSSIPSAASV
jgi:choline dehydrogenase/4-pyridoxate dehydrogenase